ncbi:Hypothetical protein FKW44_006899, partial [Caligus rogercresseyi]
ISSNSSMTRGSSASTNLYVLELHSKTESSGSSPGFWEGPTDVMGGTVGTFIKKSPLKARPSRPGLFRIHPVRFAFFFPVIDPDSPRARVQGIALEAPETSRWNTNSNVEDPKYKRSRIHRIPEK